MALAQTLQEQLTCPICQDTFTDPMVLKCHHSICQICLEGLKNASLVRWKVECPVCRAPCNVSEIQRDFRTVTLLEAQKREASGACIEMQATCKADEESYEGKGMRLCDLCKKYPVRQRCKDCDKLICQPCAHNHKSIPACKDHSLTGLADLIQKEKGTLKRRLTEMKKEECSVEVKVKEIQDYKSHLEGERTRAVQELNQWYDNMVQRAARQRDSLIHKVDRVIDSEKVGIEEKDRLVSERQASVKESLELIQNVHLEEDPAKIQGMIDSLRGSLENRSLEDTSLDVSKILIPPAPNIQVHLGKRWDESRAIHVNVKKNSGNKHIAGMLPTFPSGYTTSQLLRDKEVKITRGTKQIMIHHGLLWCLYDDHIDVHDHNQNIIVKTIKNHIAIPNGMSTIANGNVVVACMSEGLVEFTYKGKYVCNITEGSICDVSSSHKTVYTLDYSDNRPYLKAFKKTHFNKWKKTLDREIQNDKCNTFNTLLSNQTSVFISATEENVLVEYDSSGELISRITGPRATHLCCADIWGNVILTNYENTEVWMLKNDQTWHQVDVAGLFKPYSASVDEDGGLWVSNHRDTVIRYVCPPQTL